MTPAALVADLQARGVTLEPRGDRLAVRPASRLTEAELEELRRRKAQVLALLRDDAPEGTKRAAAFREHKGEVPVARRETSKQPSESPSPAPPTTLRAGAPGFAAIVARLLKLDLGAFMVADAVLEVRVPWHHEPLYFAPTATDAPALEAEGVSRGRIWTARELADLLAVPGVTKDQAQTVARAKLAVEGEVAEVRSCPSAPEPCRACRGTRSWRSVDGPLVCIRCHPPASPDLVAEWLRVDTDPTCSQVP